MQLFECLMTNRITILDRQNVLAFFGMSEVTTEALRPFSTRHCEEGKEANRARRLLCHSV